MADPTIYSIGLFIDGGYYAEIDNGLFAENRRLNLKGLINHIRKEIAAYYGLQKERCLVTESHFFRGRFRAADARQAKKLESDRLFEDRLIENDVVFHYKHIYQFPDGSIKEKGIDVWFALETLELALYRDFDFVVLITGDADHEILARKIKALKKQVILVTWDLGPKTATAPALKDEVTLHIDLKQRTADNPGLKEHICSATSVR